MTTFEQLRLAADNRKLIRKTQMAAAFLAPITVPLPDDLMVTSSELINLMEEGWLPLGMVTPDGYTFGREIESEDVTALGYASARRSDIISVARTVTATLIETGRKHILELTTGTDLSNTDHKEGTDSIVFDENDLPIGREYRLMVLMSDGPEDDLWVLGRAYYCVKLTSGGEDTWGQEGAKQNEVVFTVTADEETGQTVRHYICGSGVTKHKDILGFGDAVETLGAKSFVAKVDDKKVAA